MRPESMAREAAVQVLVKARKTDPRGAKTHDQ
jgi:hypothetical protein